MSDDHGRNRADSESPIAAARRHFGSTAGSAELATVSLLLAPLLAWDAALVSAPPSVVGFLFLLGPFLGLGVAITLVLNPARSTATFYYLSLVNAVVALTLLGALYRYAQALPYGTTWLAIGFNAVFLALVAALWTLRRERLAAIPRPAVTRRDVAFVVAAVAVSLVSLWAFHTKATTGARIPTVLVYLWVLSAFGLVYVRYPTDAAVQVVVLATAGVVMTWSQAVSSNGLVAVDGLSTVRLVRAIVFDVDTAVFSERLYHNFAIGGFLPSLSFLSQWSPYRIAKYVLPVVASLSLVGIYQLSRTWLDERSSFAAAFLLSFQFPFLVELITSYRTALAFPLIVAVYLSLASDGRARSPVAAALYLAVALLLHDTAGAFALGPLALATVLALALHWGTDREIRTDRIVSLFATTSVGVLTFYLFYSRGETFTAFASRAVSLVVSLLTGVSAGRESSRNLGTTVQSLSETIFDLLRQATIVLEVGLMAVGAGLLIAGWLWRDRLEPVLAWHDGEPFHEVLLLANAAWFGALVLQPILGVTRVFLYASPLLMGLFVFIVRQLDAVAGYLRSNDSLFGGSADRRSTPSADRPSTLSTDRLPDSSTAMTLSATVIAVLVVFGFLTQVGVLAFALGEDVSSTSLQDVDDPRYKHHHVQDVEANEWVRTHGPSVDALYVDDVSFALFDDDPELDYSQLPRMREGQRLSPMVEDGCLFVRANSYRTGQYVVRVGLRGTTMATYSLAPLDDYDTVYTTGSTRVYC